MSAVFSFFLRLFLCFVAARFLLQAVGVEGRDYLVGLTILFLANVYWFSYLVFRDRTQASAEADRRPPGSPKAMAPEPEEPPVNPPRPGPEPGPGQGAIPPKSGRRRSHAIPKG
jgi:hypothetical protein